MVTAELTMSQIITKYSVQAGQVNIWKKQAVAYLPDAFTDRSKQEATAYEVQLAKLYEEIGRMKVENDFLKKKSELFRG